MMRRWCLSIASVFFLVWAMQIAAAAEIKVLSAGAVGGAMKALAADYGRKTGAHVQLTLGNVGMIQDRLKAGDAPDIVILSASGSMISPKRAASPAAASPPWAASAWGSRSRPARRAPT
jgi:ABC-type molybdate transport system substrate-binding protein